MHTDQSGIQEKSITTEAVWWRNLVEQSRDGIVVIDQHGKVFWTNQKFASMLGYTLEEAENLEVWNWEAQFPREAVAGMLAEVQPAGAHFETVHQRKDGSTLDVEICTNAVEIGDSKLILCICRDISERKRQELEIQQLLDETKAMADKLALQKDILVQTEKLASLGKMAAGVAHEINNPLGYVLCNCASLNQYIDDLAQVVQSVVELVNLPDETEPAALQTAIGNLRQTLVDTDAEFIAEDSCQLLKENAEGIERIQKIVSNLRGYDGPEKSTPSRLMIPDLVESALAVSKSHWQDHCRIVLDQDETLPEVTWFPEQIEQVLVHLILNASRAMEGQGTIRISTHRADQDRVTISVSDDGTGMAPEILTRIFDPFFSTKDVGMGTGLGLHIVHSIVERHGGEISVESSQGEGSTLTLLLPIQVPDLQFPEMVP